MMKSEDIRDWTKEEMDYKELLLKLLASLTLCDHEGDIWDDVNTVLEVLGMKHIGYEAECFGDLGADFAKEGITTIYGTFLGDEDETEEETRHQKEEDLITYGDK